ncbi:MAG: asparagine synthase (glutamine-hydrolyzing) [Methanoregula sp.]
MCGIVGFNWSDQSILRSMMDTVKHRGPDESGFYIDNHISLGHQRLKIIDLHSGKQPIHNEDETIQIIFNGEIYNFPQLRNLLEKKGHSFYTNTDTEVIVHLYEEYGTGCVNYLNGMFAFAIYDNIKHILFLARDRIGKKPLYYWFDGTRFIFASEIKAILVHKNVARKVNYSAFQSFLQFRYTPGEDTLFTGIKKLLPAHSLHLQGNQITINKYWDVREKITIGSEDVYLEKCLKLYRSAVKSRLISDVPLGVYLSGGLDSASIVALMSECTDTIDTFSVGFGSTANSEISYARMVADEFGTNHHEFIVEDKHLSLIPKMVWHLDEPIGDAATLPTMVISQEAKKFVTVVLAGEGGDEIFAGYDNQRVMMLCSKASGILRPVSGAINALKQVLPPEKNACRLLDILSQKDLPHQYFVLNSLFNPREMKNLGLSEEPPDLSSFHTENMNKLNTLLYYGIHTWLPNDFCMKADKMTMAYGIEERAPLLDYTLVDFSFTLPVSLKLRNGSGKYILKKSMDHILPKDIIYRKKHGYNAPMDAWFKGLLKESLEHILEERSHLLYDHSYITGLLGKFQNAGNDYRMNFYNAQKLWSIFMFEMWYKIFIDRVDYNKIRI